MKKIVRVSILDAVIESMTLSGWVPGDGATKFSDAQVMQFMRSRNVRQVESADNDRHSATYNYRCKDNDTKLAVVVEDGQPDEVLVAMVHESDMTGIIVSVKDLKQAFESAEKNYAKEFPSVLKS